MSKTPFSIDQFAPLLDHALKNGATDCDVKVAQAKSFAYDQRLGTPESLERAESNGITIRLFKGQKKQTLSSTQHDIETLKNQINAALETLDLLPEDPYCGLANGDQIAKNISQKDIDSLELADAHVIDEAILIDLAKRTEAAALSHNLVENSKGAGVSFDESEIHILSSNGFKGSYKNTHYGLYVQPIAGNGETMQVDYDYTGAAHFEDLKSPEDVGIKAAEKTAAKLNPRKVKTGTYPVFYDAGISGSLFGQLIDAIAGRNIARGISFLKDKKGEQLFEKTALHLYDNPHKKRGLGSKPFDGEGFALKQLDLIKDGVLTNWIWGLNSARQCDALDDPNLRGSGITTNLTIAPGEKTKQALFKEIGTGFLATSLMSSPNSLANGDYSVGASGFWIENGIIAYPVHEVTLSSNLIDMFKNMVVANDLTTDKRHNYPTVLIPSMTVGGE